MLGHLPKEQHEQAGSTLRAAWKLDTDEGTRKLEQYASWLKREWPSATASLREGLAELFTVNRLGLPEGAPPVPDDHEHHRLVALGGAPADGTGSLAGGTRRWRCGGRAVTFRETETHYRRASPGMSISGC